MPVVMEVIYPHLSKEQYERLRATVDWVNSPPDGGISHVVWWEGNHCHSIDVWESQRAWENFAGERMGPAAAELGISMEATPVFHEPYEVLIVGALVAP